jgi:LmbE family N-acetylglucosaminyl deacetylase
MNLQIKPHAKCLAIVAHPDDETIWMGGIILKNRFADWTIFCLCRSGDPDRAPKFKKVCAYYGAKPIMTDLDDEGRLTIEESVPEIKKLAERYLKNKKFDYLFTHNRNGEYGHEGHIAVNAAILELLAEGKLEAKNSFAFNYKKTSRKKFSPLAGNKDSDVILNLSKKIFAEKKKIMTDIYGFAPDGIDVGYCTDPEAYKKCKM